MTKIEFGALIVCGFVFVTWLMISLLRGSREAEFNYPTMRLKEWKNGLAECDTIISIMGQVTDRRDKCLLVGSNAVCYFNSGRKCENVKLGDYVEVVGAVFINGDVLQLNECRLVKRSAEYVAN